jgi:hypothetical protein
LVIECPSHGIKTKTNLVHVSLGPPLGLRRLRVRVVADSDHYSMDSTSQSLAKARSPEEKSLAKAKNSRGMSAKACSAKAKNWELESAKVLPTQDASTSEVSLH